MTQKKEKKKIDLFLAAPPYHNSTSCSPQRFWTGHYDAKESTKVQVDTDAQVFRAIEFYTY